MPTNTRSTVLDYYACHSRMTDPGAYAQLLEGLPHDPALLCEIVRGLHMHYLEGPMHGITIAAERLRTDEARTVYEMLARITALNDRPLVEARPPEQRLVGCCRDYAVMLCALLRQQGVPARVRFGFGLYLSEHATNDHVVCEYWNASQQRWVLVDAQQDAAHCALNQISFDPHDIPHDRFILAHTAWQQSRAGLVDPNRFGYDPELCGLWVVQQYLVHDLAALNSVEMLIGDNWGLGSCGPDDALEPGDAALLDRVAALVAAGDAGFDDMRALYQHEQRLRVPSQVTCYHLDNEREGSTSIPFNIAHQCGQSRQSAPQV